MYLYPISQSVPFVLPIPSFAPFPFDPALTFKWPQSESEKITLFFFLLFFILSIQLAAAQLLHPREGAAKIGQLGQEKGQLHLLVVVLVDYSLIGETVPTYVLSRVFYFSG